MHFAIIESSETFALWNLASTIMLWTNQIGRYIHRMVD